MFKKVLIADDIDSINLGIISLLKNKAEIIHHARYCDEAILKIKNAKRIENAPYDLLISDLSFVSDHRLAKLKSGEELIAHAKKEQPDIKIIAYSIDIRKFRIKALFENLAVDAFVSKGREGSAELLNAIKTIHDSNTRYISPHLAHLLNDSSVLEIDENDIEILQFLSRGFGQDEIAKKLQSIGKSSSSLSSVEKKINKLKLVFKAKNLVHLVSITKDMGLI